MSKSKLVSKVLFVLSLVLFILFALTIFFGGQKIGGAIYFVFFAVSTAFAFLDRKYNSNYFEFYRYSIYLDTLVNILAVSSIIYYKQDSAFMIAILAIMAVGLFVDLFAKNRFEKRRFESIMASVLNCVFMITIFPYFFTENLPLIVPVIALVVASVVAIIKIILALVPFKGKIEEEGKVNSLEEKIVANLENNNNIE